MLFYFFLELKSIRALMFSRKLANPLTKLKLQTLLLSVLAKMSATESCSIQPSEPDALYSLTYVTIDTDENGAKLARSIIDNNLAACVNIVPKVRSIYKWKGKIEDDSEVLLMIKSKYSKLDELTKFVKKNHHYEVCEVISVPIKHGNEDYLKWIDETVKSKN